MKTLLLLREVEFIKAKEYMERGKKYMYMHFFHPTSPYMPNAIWSMSESKEFAVIRVCGLPSAFELRIKLSYFQRVRMYK